MIKKFNEYNENKSDLKYFKDYDEERKMCEYLELKIDRGNYVLAKEGQTDSKGNPYRAGQKLPHPDFIRLQGQVDYKMGKISGEPGSLLNKIADAEQRRVF